MNEIPAQTRLNSQMANMLALERAISQQVGRFTVHAAQYPAVAGLLEDLRGSADNHQEALARRLQAVAPDVPIPELARVAPPMEGLYDADRHPASAALVGLFTLFEETVIGYALMMVLARRAADSSVRGADNTDDLVQQHMRDSTASVQRIVRLLTDVIVMELEQAGGECECTCPSCGLGICLCGISTRRMLDLAWEEAGPAYAQEGIPMVHPRSGSAAAQAGMHRGDVVLAVDGKEIESIPMLQQAVRSHEPGEEIRFQVRRSSGEQSEIAVKRS